MKTPFLALSLLAAPVLAEPPNPLDETALIALAAEADIAWNEKDAERMAAAYVSDASLRMAGGVAIDGQNAIRANFERNFAARQGVMRHITSVDRIELIQPGLALTDGGVRVEQRQPDGGWKLIRSFRNVGLAVRTAAGWRLKSVRAFLTPNPS